MSQRKDIIAAVIAVEHMVEGLQARRTRDSEIMRLRKDLYEALEAIAPRGALPEAPKCACCGKLATTKDAKGNALCPDCGWAAANYDAEASPEVQGERHRHFYAHTTTAAARELKWAVFDDDGRQIVARCTTRDDAERIAAALNRKEGEPDGEQWAAELLRVIRLGNSLMRRMGVFTDGSPLRSALLDGNYPKFDDRERAVKLADEELEKAWHEFHPSGQQEGEHPEPVAWLLENRLGDRWAALIKAGDHLVDMGKQLAGPGGQAQLLYTHPPARQEASGDGDELRWAAESVVGGAGRGINNDDHVMVGIAAHRIKRLRAALDAAPPSEGLGPSRFERETLCPECGLGVSVDEDGCCVQCGATATGSAVAGIQGSMRALEQLRKAEAAPPPAMSEFPVEPEVREPMQPVVVAADGCVRFEANPLVRFLLEEGPFDMNRLAALPGVEPRHHRQFAQLIGYSVDGYCSLSYADNESCERAEDAAAPLRKRASASVAIKRAALERKTGELGGED